MSENIITIDGHELSFAPEETILDVARKNGIFIPTLCHLQGARPTGACRICIVEVEGARAFIPSCSTPAANKMVVHSNSSAVLEARRTVLALLLQSGNHNCSIADKNFLEWSDFQQQAENYDQSSELCPAHSACKLQAYAYRYQADTSGLTRAKTEYPIEMASPLIIRDFSRCIRCGRCVDACNSIQVNNAISHGFRGAETKIVAMGDSSLDRSDCVFCGECLQSCPVAALVEKKSRYEIRPWEARHVRTTCHYCGVGCQLVLHIKDNKIMKVTGAEQALPNLGRLCVKGRFGYDFVQSPERLKQPKIRKKGKLRKVSWDEALDLVASKIKEAKQKDGPESIAGICSSKSTNESIYLMQKLFRAAVGSNQLASPQAATGLNNPIGDLEKTKRILLIGCDITETNPVAGTFIKRAAKSGCQLIVVNSKPTKIGEFATSHLIVKEGTESVLINGFIQELLVRGRKGSEKISNTAKNFSPESVQETTGISKNDMKRAVDILDSDETMMLVYGSSVASTSGAFVNLQEILGNLDKECGGVSFMGDMNNSQGACDMGMSPDYLPGYGRVDNDSVRKPFEESWSCKLNTKPGLTFADMIGNMNGTGKDSGKKINLLYCVGENLVVTEPAFPGIKKALESVDFLIVQDIINNEMTEYADVILPAASWAEDEGTYTNCERRVNRMRRAVTGPEEVKPETWIFTQIANRLGRNWPEASSQEIWEKEIITLIPQLRGITYSRIENNGLQWPVVDVSSSGTPFISNNDIPICLPAGDSYALQHRMLLEQCEGLLESLPSSGGIGTRFIPSDPQEVTSEFIKLLEEEEKVDAKEKIDDILTTYRTKTGGLIPVLQQAQEILGFLPVSVQNYIAMGLGLPPSDVFGVVTFYSFFTMVPRGRHLIRICLGTACFVKGSGKLLENVERHLKVKLGETTEDREYSLDIVRCVGACGLAPVMVIDEATHGMVDPKEIVNIVESYRGKSNTG